jgi:MFS family permease
MVAFSLAGGHRAGRRLDPGRPRSDDGWQRSLPAHRRGQWDRDQQIGVAAAVYIAGACLGALFFGQLTDRFGRKKLFMLTLAVYLAATVATAFAFAPWYFFIARFFTGAGIDSEYAAINSAIDELIPARVRGRVDLAINGSYWLGSALGAAVALLLLNTSIFPANIGGSRSASVRLSGWWCSWCGATSPRVPGGFSFTDKKGKPSGSSVASSTTSSTRRTRRCRNRKAR